MFSLNDFIYFFFRQAISSFTASSPDQLSLLLGDSVHVREECDGKLQCENNFRNQKAFFILEWYFGSLANKPQVSGIFPKNFIHLKPVIVDNNQ